MSAVVTGPISLCWVELLAVSFCFFANFLLWYDTMHRQETTDVNNILDYIIYENTEGKNNVMMITDQQKRCTDNVLNECTPMRTATGWLVFREES